MNDYRLKSTDSVNRVILGYRGLRADEWKSLVGIYYIADRQLNNTQILIQVRITQDITGGWNNNRAQEVGATMDARFKQAGYTIQGGLMSSAARRNSHDDTGLVFHFPTADLDTFSNSWYSRMLTALGEPALFDLKTESEIYRFTWLRTFHNPIAFRIEKGDSGITLTTKLCAGAGGYNPGPIALDRTIALTSDQWETFLEKLKILNFWSIPSTEKRSGRDGAVWILEGRTQSAYHFPSRWSPPYTGDARYAECGKYLLALSGLKIKNKLIY